MQFEPPENSGRFSTVDIRVHGSDTGHYCDTAPEQERTEHMPASASNPSPQPTAFGGGLTPTLDVIKEGRERRRSAASCLACIVPARRRRRPLGDKGGMNHGEINGRG